MTSSVILLVTFLIFVIMGYQIDTDSGKIERTALLQFASVPSGAEVRVDGKKLSAQTPTKSTVLEGTHTFEVKKTGYNTWKKTLSIKSGTLTWLDYVMLVPLKYDVAVQQTYTSLYKSLPAPDYKHIAIQQSNSAPTFDIVDVSSDKISSKQIIIPPDIYSDSVNKAVVHSFEIDSWDRDGRYILVKHIYGDKKEWIVLDIKNTQTIDNISKTMSMDFDKLTFSGTSGNVFYGLYSGNVSKFDISVSPTVPKVLISKVQNFELYKTDVVTYVGLGQADNSQDRVVGLYREGDAEPHILRTVDAVNRDELNVATARYFDEDYLAISEGNKVTVLNGSYPASGSQDGSSLAFKTVFSTPSAVTNLSFGATGDYVLAQSGGTMTSYGVEHELINQYKLSDDANMSNVKWLDTDHLWTSFDGRLHILDFDGQNSYAINPALTDQAALLTPSGRYLYSFSKNGDSYVLQRVRLTLP